MSCCKWVYGCLGSCGDGFLFKLYGYCGWLCGGFCLGIFWLEFIELFRGYIV